MKTAMQVCLEKFMIEISNEDAEKLLQIERQQITDAFDNGKSRAYATADGKSKWKCVKQNGKLPPAWKSEEEFFNWIKVKMVHPSQRIVL